MTDELRKTLEIVVNERARWDKSTGSADDATRSAISSVLYECEKRIRTLTQPEPSAEGGVELEELERVEHEATPGDWSVYDSCSWRRIGLARDYKTVIEPCNQRSDGHPDLHARREDLDLVVALRNAAPALFAELRSLRAENARLTAKVEEERVKALSEAAEAVAATSCGYAAQPFRNRAISNIMALRIRSRKGTDNA